jgi:hypothetical protein
VQDLDGMGLVDKVVALMTSQISTAANVSIAKTF